MKEYLPLSREFYIFFFFFIYMLQLIKHILILDNNNPNKY